jgi:hypothetical protein
MLMHSRSMLLLLLLVMLVGACDSQGAGPGLTEARFVEIMIELRKAAFEHDDLDEFREKRAEILQRYAVTDSALIGFARTHGSDVYRMTAVWDSVAAGLRDVNPERID